jgi:hypothetical protein
MRARWILAALPALTLAGFFAVPAAASPATAPVCSPADLGVWVAISQGSAAAGSTFLPLEFTNLGRHACSLDGYPGVSALNAKGNQLGSAAARYLGATPRTVVIAAGATAHAELVWSDAAVYTSPHCDPTSGAQTLRVYPPGDRSSTLTMFDLEVCSRPGVTFMSVGPVVAGPGAFPG